MYALKAQIKLTSQKQPKRKDFQKYRISIKVHYMECYEKCQCDTSFAEKNRILRKYNPED